MDLKGHVECKFVGYILGEGRFKGTHGCKQVASESSEGKFKGVQIIMYGIG